VAPFHPLAKVAEPLTQLQIRKHRAVVVADSARRLTPRTTGLLSGQATVAVPSMEAKFQLQMEGLGVGYLPALCAQDAVEAGSLVRKRVEGEKPPDTLSVAWPVGAQGNALDWWIEPLASEKTVKALLDSSQWAYVSRGGRSVTAASSSARRRAK
jgi:DNA-binding transcriptional LysR family regulator